MAHDTDPIAPPETETPLGTLLRVREAADLLHCSIPTVRRMIKRKKLKAYRVGGGVRVAEADLVRLLRPVK